MLDISRVYYYSSEPLPPKPRVPRDIEVDDKWGVMCGTGGISVFAKQRQHWSLNSTFAVIPTSLPNGLTLLNDVEDHFVIAPSEDMDVTIETYEYLLSLVKFHPVSFKSVDAVTPLPSLPANWYLKSAMLISDALTTVWLRRLFFDEWDVNNYDYIATIADALNSKRLDPRCFMRTKSATGKTKMERQVAQAVARYISAERLVAHSNQITEDTKEYKIMKATHEFLITELNLPRTFM